MEEIGSEKNEVEAQQESFEMKLKPDGVGGKKEEREWLSPGAYDFLKYYIYIFKKSSAKGESERKGREFQRGRGSAVVNELFFFFYFEAVLSPPEKRKIIK